MMITCIDRWYMQLQILGGEFNGSSKLLPHIKLSITDDKLTFILTGNQFPIRLLLAMTVNNAEGQSLDSVGIDLYKPALTPGQL